jgi:ribosomal protein L12E/L44/L45/RPP1/RPP2
MHDSSCAKRNSTPHCDIHHPHISRTRQQDVSEVIAAGQAKLANVSMGGGGGDSGGASAGGAAGGAAAAAPAVEEKEEEEEVDMGGGMDM